MPLKPPLVSRKTLLALAVALSLGLSTFAAVTAYSVSQRLDAFDGVVIDSADSDSLGALEEGYSDIPDTDFVFNETAADHSEKPVLSVFVDSKSDASLAAESGGLAVDEAPMTGEMEDRLAFLKSQAGDPEDDQGEVDTSTCTESVGEPSEACALPETASPGKTSGDVMTELMDAAKKAWVKPDGYTEGMNATVRVAIHRDGRITSTTIAKSSGDEAFDLSARQAFKSVSPVASVVSLDEGQLDNLKSFTTFFKP